MVLMYLSVNLSLSNGHQGHLEVKVNGGWGTVCNNSFGPEEAR